MRAWMYLMSIGIFCLMFYLMLGVPTKATYDYSGVITDKWIETRSSFGSYTAYVFEIDNNSTMTVENWDYYNYEIGELYNWSRTYIEFEKPLG